MTRATTRAWIRLSGSQARRLRAKVDEYYAGTGAGDPVLIQLRRGSYVPAFEHRADTATPAVPEPATLPSPPIASPVVPPARPHRHGSAHRTRRSASQRWCSSCWRRAAGPGRRPAPDVDIAVLPFAEYSNDAADVALAARLTDGVTSDSSRASVPSAWPRIRARCSSAGSSRACQRHRSPPSKNADLLVEGFGPRARRRSGCRVDSPGERQPRSQDVGRRVHRQRPRSTRARAPDRPGRRACGRPVPRPVINP